HSERRSGSIESGTAADLVLLSDNLVDMAFDEIANCVVDMTVVDGPSIRVSRAVGGLGHFAHRPRTNTMSVQRAMHHQAQLGDRITGRTTLVIRGRRDVGE